MKALAVVEDLDVVVDRRASLGEIHPSSVMHELLLERAEEALDDRVVVAVAASAHADTDPERLESTAIARARVLATPVGVMQETCRGLALPERAAECCLDKLGAHVIGESPADDQPGVQV